MVDDQLTLSASPFTSQQTFHWPFRTAMLLFSLSEFCSRQAAAVQLLLAKGQSLNWVLKKVNAKPNSLIADCIVSSERGEYVGYASVALVLGPSLSPILGGIISQYAGWHW